MIQHDVLQGSTEWLQLRAKHFCASDAAAAMGTSKYKTRLAYMIEKKTGIIPSVDANTQRLFDAGHASENAQRPIAEKIVGEELYPITGSDVVDGLPLLASFDGVTMMNDVIWETKHANADLCAQVLAGDLPDTHWPQVEQQLLISGAEVALFTCGDAVLKYHSKPERRARLLASWKQFAADLETFVPSSTAAAPAASAIEALPALFVRAKGEVTDSNLPAFKAAASAFIAGINTALTTDQHFADAKSTIKFLKAGEDQLETVKAQVLAQATSIDEACRAIDAISEEMRQKRLTIDRLVTKREADIRTEIVTKHQTLLEAHRDALNNRLGSAWIPKTMGDFAGAIKGKRTVASCEDAASTALANAKIEMSALADRLELNRRALVVGDVDYFFLFADFAHVGNASAETFSAVAQQRVNKHKDEEDERKRKAEAAPPAAPSPPPAVQPRTVSRSSVATAALPPITTGALTDWLGLVVTAEFVRSLGVEPVPNPEGKRTGVFWARADKAAIRNAIIAHLSRLEV